MIFQEACAPVSGVEVAVDDVGGDTAIVFTTGV